MAGRRGGGVTDRRRRNSFLLGVSRKDREKERSSSSPFPLFRKRDSFHPSTSFPSLSKIRDRVFVICLLFIRLFIAAKIPRRGREDTRDFVVRNYRWLAERYFDAGAKLVAALLTTLRVIERGRGGRRSPLDIPADVRGTRYWRAGEP